MITQLQVLSENERAQVHERTLKVLAETGVRVDSAQGREILKDAGAQVDEATNVVCFPRSLVEESLQHAPRDFVLGARRPGWDLQMNSGDCTLLIDGEAMFVRDRETGERRPGTFDDWLEATRLIDALDEVGVYWSMVEGGTGDETVGDMVTYWRHLFRNFSKHVQGALTAPEQAPWLLEVLQVIFGDKATIREKHPISLLYCPQSPLVIEQPYTDAYLALAGWDIPIAVMPMPLMGATAPASLISTIVLGNSEVLATLCLIQAASPGTPFIYAPAFAVMNPRSGGYGGGPIEHGLLGAAITEMARYYGLPVEASGLGTDSHAPDIQAAYERAMNGLMSLLAWPDILVGPGLLGGSMTLSFEQLMIDIEIFRMARRAHRGIATDEGRWLDEVIDRAGPGGHFLDKASTVEAIHGGEWYLSEFGIHDTFEGWEAAGKPTLLEEAHQQSEHILLTHDPLPFDKDIEQALQEIENRAQALG